MLVLWLIGAMFVFGIAINQDTENNTWITLVIGGIVAIVAWPVLLGMFIESIFTRR